MNSPRTLSRWRAAGLHLGASAAIAAGLFSVLIFLWYPPPYFQASNSADLLGIIVGVDVCCGPLLTLIVFKAGKKGLKFDLTCIIVAQLLALAFGLHVMIASRPVFMVGIVDRFVLVSAEDIQPKALAAANPKWRHLSWGRPKLLGVQLPQDPKERNQLMQATFKSGSDVQDLPRYYVPYSKVALEILTRAHPIAELCRLNPERHAYINRWFQEHHKDPRWTAWVPVETRGHNLAMLLNGHNGVVLEPLLLQPWAGSANDPSWRARYKPPTHHFRIAPTLPLACP